MGSSFNLSVFTAKQDGYFFFYFSAGYPWFSEFLSITLTVDDDVNLFELTTNISHFQFPYSASYITWLARNQTVCITSEVEPYSDKFGQTLFLGFRLDQHMMNSFVTSQLLLFHNNGVIHIVQNFSFGIHWVSSNNSVQFSFPTGGIYLTNLCIKFVGWGGIVKKQKLPLNINVTLFETYVSLKYNDNPVKKMFASHAQNRVKVFAVAASASRIILIEKNYKMTMDYMLPNNAEVSVQFISYSPTVRQRVIWSLKYSQILLSKVNGFTADIIEGALIKNSYELEIRQEGIYYVSLSAYVMSEHLVNMHVTKHGESIVSFDLPQYATINLDHFTFYRANLAHLKEAAVLYFGLYIAYLYPEEEIYFIGFLLYPVI